MLGALHTRTAGWINRQDQTPARKVWHNFWDTKLTYQKSYLARLIMCIKTRLNTVSSQWRISIGGVLRDGLNGLPLRQWSTRFITTRTFAFVRSYLVAYFSRWIRRTATRLRNCCRLTVKQAA